MNPTIEISFKTAQAYSAMCKPLCQELKLPQTAFDILMFLANNPDCTTARDIVEIRKIKANLVSVNVDRLVQEGYLERRAVAGDRRKTQLLCTEKAQPVIARGREVQERFFARLLHNTDAATREAFSTPWRSSGKSGRDLKGEWINELAVYGACHLFAGMGAGLGTGFAGMSAAAVISPMLITFLHMDPYMAVGIALSSDVLASAVSAYTYHKNKNLDIKNGLIMMQACLPLRWWAAGWPARCPPPPWALLGVHDLLVGCQVHPAPGHDHQGSHAGGQRAKACGAVGGVRRAYRLHLRLYRRGRRHDDAAHSDERARVRAENRRRHERFIMAFTALTGAVSHFMIGGAPDWTVWALCVVFTLLWARIAAVSPTGRSENAQPRDRRGARCSGRSHHAVQGFRVTNVQRKGMNLMRLIPSILSSLTKALRFRCGLNTRHILHGLAGQLLLILPAKPVSVLPGPISGTPRSGPPPCRSAPGGSSGRGRSCAAPDAPEDCCNRIPCRRGWSRYPWSARRR